MLARLEELVEEELRPNEDLIWCGRCLSQRGQQRRAPVGSAAYRKSHTIYALTNLRVFVLRDFSNIRQFRSLPLQFLRMSLLTLEKFDERESVEAFTSPDHYLREVKWSTGTVDDRGSIEFFTSAVAGSDTEQPYIRFFKIEGADWVFRLAMSAKAAVDDRSR